MTIEEIKKLASAWADMLKEERDLPTSKHTSTSDMIAIVQLNALLQVYEKLDSVEHALFIVLANIGPNK